MGLVLWSRAEDSLFDPKSDRPEPQDVIACEDSSLVNSSAAYSYLSHQLW